jgi:hypothetical protein
METDSYHSDIQNIFIEVQIKDIYESTNPIGVVYDIIESHHRRNNNNTEYDSNVLTAISEFHVNNLIFLKQNFTFPDSIYSKLLNLLSVLLELRDDQVKTTDNDDNIQEIEDPNFAEICIKKLSDIKSGLFELNLIPNNNNTGSNFYLKNTEIVALLDYIKTFYFPFIRLYYHFVNIQKITETKKIDIVINRPLPIPPLSLAVMQAQDKNYFEEPKEIKEVNEVNVEEKKEEVKNLELNKENKTETAEEIMTRLGLNQETQNIIAEKIQELRNEVNYKISDREKKLELRLKEVEDTIKGKKK